MKLMKVLEAAILFSSPLSNTPKPQMPPHSAGSPDSVGNAMNRMSSPLLVVPAALLSALVCWAMFQQKAICRVPLRKRVISSPPLMEASKLMPSWLYRVSIALTFSAESAVYLVWAASVKVPPYMLLMMARVPWSPPWPLQ